MIHEDDAQVMTILSTPSTFASSQSHIHLLYSVTTLQPAPYMGIVHDLAKDEHDSLPP